MRNSFAPRLCQLEVKRLIILMGLIAATLLICQSLMPLYRNAIGSYLTVDHDILEGKGANFHLKDSSENLLDVGVNAEVEVPYTASTSTSTSTEPDVNGFEFVKGNNIHDPVIDSNDRQKASDLEDEGMKVTAEFIGKAKFIDDFKLDENLPVENTLLESTKQKENEVLERDDKTRHNLSIQQIIRPYGNISANANPKEFKTESIEEVHRGNALLRLPLISLGNDSYSEHLVSDTNTSPASQLSLPNDHISSEYNRTSETTSPIVKKKSCDTPPKSVTLISEMNRILLRNRRASRSMVISKFLLSNLICVSMNGSVLTT